MEAQLGTVQVVLAGYPDAMQTLMRTDPGKTRKFSIYFVVGWCCLVISFFSIFSPFCFFLSIFFSSFICIKNNEIKHKLLF